MSKNEFPGVTQQPVIYVDGTPDKDYPLRILKVYRENCNCKWVDNSEGKESTNPLIKIMNDHCDERAKILDKAIRILQKALFLLFALCPLLLFAQDTIRVKDAVSIFIFTKDSVIAIRFEEPKDMKLEKAVKIFNVREINILKKRKFQRVKERQE